jgi:hypothetical protein
LSTSAATQIRRTKWANEVTTQNQQLGLRCNDAQDLAFWMGNAPGLGGWYFSCIFEIEAWPADTCRLFIGLCNSNTSQVVNNNLTATDAIGLWHDTTDTNPSLTVINRNNGGGQVKNPFEPTTAFSLAAGQAYKFEMSQNANMQGDGESAQVRCILTSVNSGARYLAIVNGAYRNSIFMAPQVQMSNGTANIVANTVAIGVANVLVTSGQYVP